ncbi:MAG: septal ring lytic transglycosylase RlpA family protein [Gloeobacterales cyanobacterium]
MVSVSGIFYIALICNLPAQAQQAQDVKSTFPMAQAVSPEVSDLQAPIVPASNKSPIKIGIPAPGPSVPKASMFVDEKQNQVIVYFDQLPLLTIKPNKNDAQTSTLEAAESKALEITKQLNLLDWKPVEVASLKVIQDDEGTRMVAKNAASATSNSETRERTLWTLDKTMSVASTSKTNQDQDLEATAVTILNRVRSRFGVAPVASVEKPNPIASAGNAAKNVVMSVLNSFQGGASWYGGNGDGFHGRRTASGVTFNTYSLMAAHKSLPFGTRVLVTNLANGKQVVVKIMDRGPYIGGRVIDLSKAAAQLLGMLNTGVARVRVDVLGR